MKGRCLVLYGDIIFETAVLEKLLKSPADISLVVDLAWYDQQQHGHTAPHIKPDLVSLQNPPGKSYLFRYIAPDEQNRIVKIGQHVPHEHAHGEFIGLAMFSERGIEAFKQVYRDAQKTYQTKGFHEAGSLTKATFTDMIQELIDNGHSVNCVPTFKGWMEVDSFEEYQQAWAKIRS
jgi:phosphoenolpyruvate phosphomutase